MKQFSRFIAVGVLNTAVGYAVIFGCMYAAGMGPELSNIAGYAVGLVVSYVMNRNYTFGSKQEPRREIVRFLVVFGIAYGANMLVLLALINGGSGLNAGVAQVVAGVAYIAVSYLLSKFYVFREAGNA
jgi:putative flippase GtrA